MVISTVWQSDWVIHTYILFHILSHYGLSQDIEYSSLCDTARPPCLYIQYIAVCICSSWTPIHPSPVGLGNHKSILYESVSVSYISSFKVHILDSTYKWYHMVFVFLFLTWTSFSMIIFRSIHVAANGIISFSCLAK